MSPKSTKHREPQARQTQGRTNQETTATKPTKIKDKEKKTKSNKGRTIHKETFPRLSVDFSADSLQTVRQWHNIFKVMKRKNLQPRTLYLATLSFSFDREKVLQAIKS